MTSLQTLTIFLGVALFWVKAKNLPSKEWKANIIQDLRMRMGVRTDYATEEEEVELNYEQNYVRISIPGISGASSVILIHDYNLNQTLYKANGRCFMLDGYNDLPPTLHDWTTLEEIAVDGIVNSSGPDGYRTQLYRLLPFSLNRTSLSPAIQQECPGEINAVVLQEIHVQQEAYEYMQSNLGRKGWITGKLFQPTTYAARQKRSVRDDDVVVIVVVIRPR